MTGQLPLGTREESFMMKSTSIDQDMRGDYIWLNADTKRLRSPERNNKNERALP